MKIHIDTKEDSPEELRKVIRFLSHIIGDDYRTNSSDASNQRNIFDSDSPSVDTPGENSSVFGAMFDDSAKDDSDNDDSEAESSEESEDIQIVSY